MPDPAETASRLHRWLLVVLLVATAAFRSFELDAPLVDGVAGKQIYVAHRARQIVGPPFSLTRSTFDFLAEDGQQLVMQEEIPLFPGLVAAGYVAFGEREWLGRLASVIATVVAVAALYDLLRRHAGRTFALVAAYLFSFTPLLLFYGRAYQADAAMLACMLLAACAHDRFLARPRAATWLLTLLFCLLATAFKYFGLMAVPPLGISALQQKADRWRHLLAVGGITAITGGVAAAWVSGVFFASHNPTREGEYFIHQMPWLLAEPEFYLRFFDRFLYKGCGVILLLLCGVGVAAAAMRRAPVPQPLWGWAVTGVLFFVLLGPKVRYHNYYELMMLPAAAMWGAIGWCAGWRAGGRWIRIGLLALLAAAPVVHTRGIWRVTFDREAGLHLLAGRMRELCGDGGRFVVAGPFSGCVTVHYSRVQGWCFTSATDEMVERCRRQGAGYLLVYLNHNVPAEAKPQLRELITRWPLVEKGVERWDVRGKEVEYYIVRLQK